MRLLVYLCFLLMAMPVFARDVVVLDARIYTGLNEEPLHGAIRIRDGKIVEVAQTFDVSGSAIYTVNGGYVTAGFIDSRSTVGIEEVGLSTKTEDQKYEGEAIGASFDPSLAFHFNSSALPALLEEGVTHAVVTPEPGKDVLAGQSTLVSLAPGKYGAYANAKAVHVYLGEQGRDLAGKSRAAALQRLIEGLEDARLYDNNRRAYQSNRLRPLSLPRTDLEALTPVVRGEKNLALYVDRASEIVTVLEALDRFKLKIVLVGAREAWKVVNSIKNRNIPVLINPLDNVPRSFDRLGARLDQPALLYRAGITFGFMTENQFTRTRRLSQGAGVSVAYGLPWLEALRAVTINPARIWGVDSEIGTLEPGKDATLVVWDGDPLEITSHATRVMIKGQWVDAENRQQLLRDRYSEIDKISFGNR